MNAPDMRPTSAAGAASTGETAPDAQLEHQFTAPEGQVFPNFVAMRRWIRVNRPDLYERIQHINMVPGLKILNAETGLSISENDDIEATAPLILAALQAQQRATP